MGPKMQFLAIVAISWLCGMTTANWSEQRTFKYMNTFGLSLDDWTLKQDEKAKAVADSEVYLNEHLEDRNMRKKREANSEPALIRKERAIHREGSFLKINLVSFHHADGSRSKRATYNTTTETWPHQIPYKFDTEYPIDLIPKVRRIMSEIMDNVCIEWIEEPDFDPNNNDYPTNAYLNFVGSDGNICGTFLGQGDGDGPRAIKTCTQYYAITHELLHTLGVIHEQQGPLSLKHLTTVKDNILDGYWGGTYKLHDNPGKIETSEFDGSSIMMYGRRSFSRNGLHIQLPFREEEFDINYDRHTSMLNIFSELNDVYKCNELYCANADVDCGLGHHTRVKGVCQCVCPDGFDPAHNCRQLEDETSGPQTWPDVPFSLYAAGVGVCPAGFNAASFHITGTRNPIWFGDPFFSTGQTTDYLMCTRAASTSNTDMDILPMGTYCVVKPKNLPCNGGFEEGSYFVRTTQAFTSTGDFGDWVIQSFDPSYVEMKYCCRDDRDWFYTMELPRQTGFRLVSENGQCPVIKGMRFEVGRIAMFNANTQRVGHYPQSWLASYYLVHNFCTYTAPVYGCNQNITLDAGSPSIEIKTPGFDAGQRESNRRCLYNFNVPSGARVRVTINKYEVDATDLFNTRRFNKWAMPLYDFSQHYVPQFISEKEFLMLEWWSGRTASSMDGIHMTAELLLDDCCSDKGRSYDGQKSVSEMFEQCVPWSEAAGCQDFPYSGIEAIELLSSDNHCRSPGGEMERPWCYVSVDMGVCRRAYCDVCNELNDADRLTNCASLAANDPQFCTDALQRTKCAQTCALNLNQESDATTGTCGTPSVPSDGTPLSPLETSYDIGDIVPFDCNLRTINESPTEIQCTEHGWPSLDSACTECPLGWIPYGDRCFHYTPEPRWVDVTHDYCTSKGGRVFVLRNATDVEIIRTFKQTSTIPSAYGGSWVNIQLVNSQWVLYDNHSVVAPYTDWAPNAVIDDPENACAVMIWEYDTNGYAGSFLPTSCNLAMSRTFCEMPRSPMTVCSNKSPACASILASDPEFCRRPVSYPVASLYCEESCGNCVEEPIVCEEPASSTYRSTTPFNATQGDVMTFACDAGFYHTAGDLQRACGTNGNLLGVEPVCTAVPNSVDIGNGGVIRREDSSSTNKIHLLDIEGFRIPYDGEVTHWHYYGSATGTIYFVVYRKDLATGLFQLVGHNTVTISTLKERWTVAVLTGRIPVQEGDVYGFFTIDGQIAVTTCAGFQDSPMTLITEAANDVSGLSGDKPFTDTDCLVPSLGLRVAPAN